MKKYLVLLALIFSFSLNASTFEWINVIDRPIYAHKYCIFYDEFTDQILMDRPDAFILDMKSRFDVDVNITHWFPMPPKPNCVISNLEFE
jgi:hypothetical protein